MKPYYEQDGITIYHGDCRDVLPSLSGPFDSVLTDPPFGIGFKYESHDDTPDGYAEFIWPVIEACERLSRPGASVFVWQTMKNVRHFHKWFPREWRIFVAAKSFVQMRPIPMQYAFDPVLVWWVPGEKPWRSEKGDGVNRDFHIARNAGLVSKKTLASAHPCPRPEDQVSYIVAQWVPPGGLIVDPFMGSGTTLVSAKRQGRKAIGIEIEERYCEIAAKRLAQGALPLEMGA